MLNKLAIMKNNTSSSSNNSSLTSNVSIPVPSATSNMAYNLHLLQSKFGGYAALNAVVNAVQQQQQQQQQQNNHYYNGFNFWYYFSNFYSKFNFTFEIFLKFIISIHD